MMSRTQRLDRNYRVGDIRNEFQKRRLGDKLGVFHLSKVPGFSSQPEWGMRPCGFNTRGEKGKTGFCSSFTEPLGLSRDTPIVSRVILISVVKLRHRDGIESCQYR